jgi:NAD(P)-dependent dehydrogenase (short-subunit alcohol dehydrogenase family)
MSITFKNIAIIGSSGAIGGALVDILSDKYPDAKLHAFSRNRDHIIDYKSEESIRKASDIASKNGDLDLVVVTNGILHDRHIMPEKSLKELSKEKFHSLFEVNVIEPALVAKYFLPKLNRKNTSIFSFLSARVGSISDNTLGGWYSYRASKAALNMVIKNSAIEIGRRNKNAIIVGLHPGTVDSNLSKFFQGNVTNGSLFTPNYSALKLLKVMDVLTPNESGKCFAWDGKEILP